MTGVNAADSSHRPPGLKVGDLVKSRSTGTARIVDRITPPGAAGTRVSDGPTYHARLASLERTVVVDIWSGSTSSPTSDYVRAEWWTHQACAECGSLIAYPRPAKVADDVRCRRCGHVNPLDTSSLGELEEHVWVNGYLAVAKWEG